MPVPALKYNDLISDINALLIANKRDEVALMRIRRQAESLLDADKIGSLTLLGTVAGLLGDEKTMHARHLAVLELTDGSSDALYNYANTLAWAGNYSSALAMAKRAYEASHAPAALGLMIISAQALGLASLFRTLCAQWHELTGRKHELDTGEPPSGRIRDGVMARLEDDMSRNAELWTRLSNV
jgi:tetratricopeptide (TPR) repeat protein